LISDFVIYRNITELTVFEWIKFIAVKPDLESSAEFAERVLTIVSKQYQHTSNAAQNDILGVLKVKKCIPTRYGLKVPSAAYFPSVNLFDDLPVIDFKAPRSLNETFLTSLGVRKVKRDWYTCGKLFTHSFSIW
jgi:hypothetical protein